MRKIGMKWTIQRYSTDGTGFLWVEVPGVAWKKEGICLSRLSYSFCHEEHNKVSTFFLVFFTDHLSDKIAQGPLYFAGVFPNSWAFCLCMSFICGAVVLKGLQVLNFSSDLELCQKQCLGGAGGDGEATDKRICVEWGLGFWKERGSRTQTGGIPLALSPFAEIEMYPVLPRQGTVEAQQTLYLSYLRFGHSK